MSRPPNHPDQAATAQGSAPLAGVRVLLAEDNPTNQMIALHMLGRLGCESELVPDGLEVLRRLDQASFDLVLMDIQMPRFDGFQATLEIRRREAEGWVPGGGPAQPGRLPVIAMTANASAGDRERCLDAQMDDYLSKPVTIEQLASVLSRWVAGGPRRPPSPPPAAPAEAPPDLRIARLEEVSLGDTEFEREFLSCLLSDITESLNRLHAALDPFDPERATNSLHGIVGACRTVGADALARVARKAEEQALAPGFVPESGWLDPIEAARDRLVTRVAARLGNLPG